MRDPIRMRHGNFSMRHDLPGQLEMPQTGEDTAGLAKQKALAPMRAPTTQKPCDVGLFGDSAAQLDLIDKMKG